MLVTKDVPLGILKPSISVGWARTRPVEETGGNSLMLSFRQHLTYSKDLRSSLREHVHAIACIMDMPPTAYTLTHVSMQSL